MPVIKEKPYSELYLDRIFKSFCQQKTLASERKFELYLLP